jgi:hypothetical protein
MLCFSSSHGLMRRIHSRREHRKQRRRQEAAMEEARAAGWKPYCEEDDSSEEELAALNDTFGVVSPTSTTAPEEESSPTDKRTAEDYSDDGTSDSDDDEDDMKDDATALDVEGIDQVLAHLELQHPLNTSCKPQSALISTIASNYHHKNTQNDDSESEQERENERQNQVQEYEPEMEPVSSQSQIQMIAPFYEGGEGTETTVDLTETEGTSDESAHLVDIECAPPVTTLRRIDDESSSGDSTKEDEDDDSLDLGVPTSMWPSLENNTNNHVTGAFPTRSKSPMPCVHISNLTRDFFVHEENLQALEDDNSLGDNNEGTQVFLAKEGARYTGNQNDMVLEMGNIDSYCEDWIPSFKSSNPEHMEVNKLFQQNEWKDRDSNESDSSNEEAFDQEDDPLFRPRHEQDNTNHGLEDEIAVSSNLDAKAGEATKDLETMKKSQQSQTENTCFGGLQLVTTSEFEELKEENVAGRKEPSTPSLTSPLSSMVFFMDLDLYVDKTKTPVYKDCDVSVASDASDNFSMDSVASAPVHRNPGRLLNSEKYIIEGIHSNDRRSRLSSSFISSTRTGRAAYSLSAGKKAMSKSEIALVKSYLPQKPFLEISGRPNLSKKRSAVDRSLYVLLVETSHKIFEVVKVNLDKDTKVGDVLAKARAAATDPALSEQKYTSLCKAGQEFAAPMLPVNLLIDWSRNKSSPLVVAVPVGSSAAEMQMIKHVLWQNPKLKRWWKQKDPFQPRNRRGRTETQNPSTPDTIPETPPAEVKHLDTADTPLSDEECTNSLLPSLQERTSYPSIERFEL